MLGPEGWAARASDPDYGSGLFPLQEMALWSRSETIWGGSSQVQRTIVAEQVLGLPRVADDDRLGHDERTSSTPARCHLKVLDLSRMYPGALCTMLLADLGADVLKVEGPGAGDGLRQVAMPESFNATHTALNRGKRSTRAEPEKPWRRKF